MAGGGQKRIAKELRDLTEHPPRGFDVSLVDESDLYRWKVILTGPEGSPFAGGKFTILLALPKEYPFRPPSINFITKIWHPNVTQDGATPTLHHHHHHHHPYSTATSFQQNNSDYNNYNTNNNNNNNNNAAIKSYSTRGNNAVTTTTTSTSTSTSAEPVSSSHMAGSMCIGLLRPEEWKPSSRIVTVLEFARTLMREPQPEDAVEPRIAESYRERRKEWEQKAKEWTKKYARID